MPSSGYFRRISLALAAFFIIGAALLTFNPVYRTKGFFAFQRTWEKYWPFEFGRWSAESRLMPLMQRIGPFVPVRVEIEPGVNMLLDPDDVVSGILLRKGIWEPQSLEIMRSHLPAGSTFIDIGAHIGYYSLKASRWLGPNGTVVAIEPNPPTVERLRDNIRYSSVFRVLVQPVACAESESTLDFYASPRGNTGMASMSRGNASHELNGEPTRYRVRARPLDDIVAELRLSRVDFMKLDVEGAEMLVLKGAKQTLARFRPALLVETIDRQLQGMGTSTAEMSAFLTGMGYVARRKLEADVEWVSAAAPTSGSPNQLAAQPADR
jgi:FkbM family methyltransferase